MFLVMWGGVTGTVAQKSAVGELSVEKYELLRSEDRLEVGMFFDGARLRMPKNRELKVQPVLVFGKQDSLFLPYMLFAGGVKERIRHRQWALGGKRENRHELYSISGNGEDVSYRQVIPYRPEYFESRLVLKQELNKCAGCTKRLATVPLDTLKQRFRVAYLVPAPAEEEEKRISLYVQFPLNKDRVFRLYGDNYWELRQLVQDIKSITDQPHLKLTGIYLTGYASPEGNYDRNADLAYTRAHRVRDFLLATFPEDRDKVFLDFTPEDWNGLLRLVEERDRAEGMQVRRMLEQTPSPSAREQRIKELLGAAEYRRLLDEAYPRLRRVDCRIRYRTDAEADKQRIAGLVKEDPESMSVHDFFVVAGDYTPGSPEFHKVMGYAQVWFPENEEVNHNRAAYALQTGDIATARKKLSEEDGRMEVLNNRAVLLFLEGKREQALSLFREAEKAGCAEAGYNLRKVLAVND